MRHLKKGRVLGRSPAHRKALLRNLASALFLTEREPAAWEENKPKVRGRIITTLAKAKEVRGLVEKCITIAKRARVHEEAAQEFATAAPRNSEAWQQWRNGPDWRKWVQARAPAVAARRRVLQLLGDRQAMRLCFDVVAPRFVDRPGGYTRILKLSRPRLGDAGPRAILEFVGQNDRVAQRPQAPAIEPAAEG